MSIIAAALVSLGMALLPGGSYFIAYLLLARIDPTLAVLGMLGCYVLSSKRECTSPSLSGDVGLVETSPQDASPAQVALLKCLGLTVGYVIPAFYAFSGNQVLIALVALALALRCRDVWLEALVYAGISLLLFHIAQELHIANPVPAISTALLLPPSKERPQDEPDTPVDMFIGGASVVLSTLSGISGKAALIFSRKDHPSLAWGAFVEACGEGIALSLLAKGTESGKTALSAELITTGTLPPHPLLCLAVMLACAGIAPYLPVIDSRPGAIAGAFVTAVFVSGPWGLLLAPLGFLITPYFPARVKLLVFLVPILAPL